MREQLSVDVVGPRVDVARQRLAVTLLNGFAVSVGGAPVPSTAWRTQKGRSLIKILALAPGHQLHREQIIDMLWPELDPSKAINNWRSTLHSVRAALEPGRTGSSTYLVLTHDMLRLEAPDGLWLDVDAFRAATETCRLLGSVDSYEVALALYPGHLLPEDCYEDWAIAPRETLRESWLSLMVELAGLHEAAGEWAAGVAVLERVTASAPTHEDAHTGLMRIHALAGRPGQAIRQYARLREELARELDVGPIASTHQLHADIASGRFGTGGASVDTHRGLELSATRTNVPVPLDRFIDRGAEIAGLRRLVEAHRLVTITGVGGSGKTRLAVEFARRRVGFGGSEDVWFVELAAIRDPRALPGVVAAAVHATEERDASTAESLAKTLASRSTLLVLDNCEHLVAACAELVGQLLGTCLGLRILTTSRESLRVAGEVTWAVRPLDVPPPLAAQLDERALGALRTNEALMLLVERIREVRPTFALTTDNAAPLADICRRLDGLPLAIELAAARAAVLGPEGLAARLDQALGLLTDGRRSAPERQRTLRATLDWSHDLLDPIAQALFRRLAVFAGGWTLAAAEDVCASGEEGGPHLLARVNVLDALTHLIDKSMVQVDDTAANAAPEMRYTMLETVRLYAAEQLVRSGENDDVRGRHIEFFIGLAEAAEDELTGRDQAEWCAQMVREHSNFRAGLRWATDCSDLMLEARLGAPLWRYWHDTDRHAEGDRRFVAIMAQAEVGDLPPLLRGRLMQGASALAWARGDVERAHALGASALDLFRGGGDKQRVAATLDLLGMVCTFTSRNGEARRYLQESLDLRAALGDHAATAGTLRNLGNVARRESDPVQAMNLYERSLALDRAAGNVRSVAMNLTDLGTVALDVGDAAAAEHYAVDSLLMFERLPAQSPRAAAMYVLGFAHLHQGRADRAVVAHQSCLRIAADCGNRRATILGLEGTAAVVGSAGHGAGALVAARLLGAAGAARDRIDMPLPECDARLLATPSAAARAAIGDEEFEAATERGRLMPIEEAVALGLSSEWTSPSRQPAPAGASKPLTRREHQVAELVAANMTNAAIAHRLGIARRTVDTHVNSVLRKLGVRSRLAIGAALRSVGKEVRIPRRTD